MKKEKPVYGAKKQLIGEVADAVIRDTMRRKKGVSYDSTLSSLRDEVRIRLNGMGENMSFTKAELISALLGNTALQGKTVLRTSREGSEMVTAHSHELMLAIESIRHLASDYSPAATKKAVPFRRTRTAYRMAS